MGDGQKLCEKSALILPPVILSCLPSSGIPVFLAIPHLPCVPMKMANCALSTPPLDQAARIGGAGRDCLVDVERTSDKGFSQVYPLSESALPPHFTFMLCSDSVLTSTVHIL